MPDDSRRRPSGDHFGSVSSTRFRVSLRSAGAVRLDGEQLGLLTYVLRESNPPARLPSGVPAGGESERPQHKGAHATAHPPIIAKRI
jgi:hypothetical protein